MNQLHKVLQFPAKEPAAAPKRKPRESDGSILKRTETKRVGGKSKKVIVYYARVRYTDDRGRPREKKRKAGSYDDAIALRRKLQAEIQSELAGETVDRKRKYFSEVLDHYEAEYVKPAEYAGNQKVAGLREPLAYVRRHLNLFREIFGGMYAGSITYDDLREFKAVRLAEPVRIEYWEKIPIPDEERKRLKTRKRFRKEKRVKVRPRAAASVHRELERLRRIFNIAVRQGWIQESPFRKGDPLISHSVEEQRVRILSFDEERRLLAACTGRREHLRAIVICALDTCIRKNEMFTLTWKDVDLRRGRITVQALNAKTGRERTVPISSRLMHELRELRTVTEDLVFGIETNADTAFENALEAAGIRDFRFHDMRGTGITRLLRAGMPATEVMKISGHTQWSTFMRYVKVDDDTLDRAKSALDAYLTAQA